MGFLCEAHFQIVPARFPGVPGSRLLLFTLNKRIPFRTLATPARANAAHSESLPFTLAFLITPPLTWRQPCPPLRA